ncbi:MAG: hypothetical protein JRI52_01295 [Deltaproteobacteria bacterium]|nr:hypothetical protein [Deltaproteobacteria bacterium]
MGIIENKTGDQHRQVSEIKKKICIKVLILTLAAGIFFIILNERSIVKGLALGSLFSIVNFLLLGESIPLVLGHTRIRAGVIGLASIVIRFSVLTFPLLVGLKSDSFNFAAVVAGIFSVQIVTLVEYIIIRPLLEE